MGIEMGTLVAVALQDDAVVQWIYIQVMGV